MILLPQGKYSLIKEDNKNLDACYNNGLHLILTLTTTKFAIQNGINQPFKANTFLSMDHYVTKLEKRFCMVLSFEGFYAQKRAGHYRPTLYVLNV